LAYDNLSPKSSVDQAYTKRAVEEVESFMKKYPFSTYKKEINAIYKKLTTRLEKKDYDIAKNYYDLSYYKSAIVTFNNFLQNYSGSVYKERALFYRFKAAATLALKSVESKKEDRLQQAIGYYENYIKKYPKTEHKKEADIIKEKLVTQLTSKKETSVNK
jgi:outer membrane protein assembly factor BamD